MPRILSTWFVHNPFVRSIMLYCNVRKCAFMHLIFCSVARSQFLIKKDTSTCSTVVICLVLLDTYSNFYLLYEMKFYTICCVKIWLHWLFCDSFVLTKFGPLAQPSHVSVSLLHCSYNRDPKWKRVVISIFFKNYKFICLAFLDSWRVLQ